MTRRKINHSDLFKTTVSCPDPNVCVPSNHYDSMMAKGYAFYRSVKTPPTNAELEEAYDQAYELKLPPVLPRGIAKKDHVWKRTGPTEWGWAPRSHCVGSEKSPQDFESADHIIYAPPPPSEGETPEELSKRLDEFTKLLSVPDDGFPAWPHGTGRIPMEFGGWHAHPFRFDDVQESQIKMLEEVVLPTDVERYEFPALTPDFEPPDQVMAVQSRILQIVRAWENGDELLTGGFLRFGEWGIRPPGWMYYIFVLDLELRRTFGEDLQAGFDHDEARVDKAVLTMLRCAVHDIYHPLLSPAFPMGVVLSGASSLGPADSSNFESDDSMGHWTWLEDFSFVPYDFAFWWLAPYPNTDACIQSHPEQLSRCEYIYSRKFQQWRLLTVEAIDENLPWCIWFEQGDWEERERELLDLLSFHCEPKDWRQTLKAMGACSVMCRAPIFTTETELHSKVHVERMNHISGEMAKDLRFYEWLRRTWGLHGVGQIFSRYWYTQRIHLLRDTERLKYWPRVYEPLPSYDPSDGKEVEVILREAVPTPLDMETPFAGGEGISLAHIFEADDPYKLALFCAGRAREYRIDQKFALVGQQAERWVGGQSPPHSLHMIAVATGAFDILHELTRIKMNSCDLKGTFLFPICDLVQKTNNGKNVVRNGPRPWTAFNGMMKAKSLANKLLFAATAESPYFEGCIQAFSPAGLRDNLSWPKRGMYKYHGEMLGNCVGIGQASNPTTEALRKGIYALKNIRPNPCKLTTKALRNPTVLTLNMFLHTLLVHLASASLTQHEEDRERDLRLLGHTLLAYTGCFERRGLPGRSKNFELFTPEFVRQKVQDSLPFDLLYNFFTNSLMRSGNTWLTSKLLYGISLTESDVRAYGTGTPPTWARTDMERGLFVAAQMDSLEDHIKRKIRTSTTPEFKVQREEAFPAAFLLTATTDVAALFNHQTVLRAILSYYPETKDLERIWRNYAYFQCKLDAASYEYMVEEEFGKLRPSINYASIDKYSRTFIRDVEALGATLSDDDRACLNLLVDVRVVNIYRIADQDTESRRELEEAQAEHRARMEAEEAEAAKKRAIEAEEARRRAAAQTEESRAAERERQKALEAERKANAERKAREAEEKIKREKADKALDGIFGWTQLERALKTDRDEQEARTKVAADIAKRKKLLTKDGLLASASPWKREHLTALSAWLKKGAARGEAAPPQRPTEPESEPELEPEPEPAPPKKRVSFSEPISVMATVLPPSAPAYPPGLGVAPAPPAAGRGGRGRGGRGRGGRGPVSDVAGPSGVNPPPPEIPGDVCVVCEDAKRTTLFLPCAHIATCDLCAMKILNAGALCCICRTPIEKVLRPKFA